MKVFFKKAISVFIITLMIFQLATDCFLASAAELPADSNGFVFSECVTGKAPDISYHNEGTKVTVEEFPSEKNKSLCIQTKANAYQFFIDLPIYSGSNECVIETSVAYEGTLASFKRIFTVGGTGDPYVVFMTLSRDGSLVLYDGSLLTTLKEGVFCDITLTINFESSSCSVKIDGKTVAMDIPLPTTNGKLVDADNSRIQISDITGDTEKFYINYYYTTGEKSESDEKTTKPTETVVTDSSMRRSMKNHILMTTKNGKARVDNNIVDIDSENPDVAPTIINGRTLVPLRFISESLDAKVEYDDISSTATIRQGETVILITADQKEYTINGETKTFDVPPVNISGRMLVPLRAISEALSQNVFWDKCGYILIGENADKYNLNNQEDKKTLDLAVRDLIFESPAQEEIISLIKEKNPNNDHPRLLFRKEDLPALRQKVATDPQTAEYMKNVISIADKSLDLEPLKWGRVDGTRMLQTFRKARERIENMAFAYLITQDKKYADGAIDVMMNICGDNFPDWNPYHFLDVGELSSGIALGYDWCYDAMTDNQRQIVEKALAEKSLKEILKDLNFETTSEDRSFKWNSSAVSAYPQNWVAVCVGGCSMAALVIGDKGDEYSLLAGEVISKGIEHVKDLLAKFAPDGAWHEGPNYWILSYEYFAFGFESYLNALGTDFGLTDSIGFHDGGYYLVGNTGPQGSFNLDTCAPTVNDCPEIYWLADVYNDSTLTVWRRMFMDKMAYKGGYRDVIWYRPDLDTSNTDGLTLDGMWREFNVSSSRTGFTDSDLFVAFHGAEYNGLNSQLDSGTFVMDMFGVRWATEVGYDPRDYSDGGKITRYRGRGEGHNTMIFNPDDGADLNQYARSPIIRHEYNNFSSISISDLTQAHIHRDAENVKRGIMVDKVQKYVVIQDEFQMSEPSEMYWFMHTQGDIDIMSDGRCAILSKDNKKMLVKLLSDENFKFEKMPSVSLPTSPDVEMEDDSEIWKLFIHNSEITSGTISVAICPLAGNEYDADISYTVTPLSNWSLKQYAELPYLTEITVGGRDITINNGQTIYSEKFDIYANNGIGYEISAKGNGDIQITQISDDNNIAKISVTKDGITNNYYFSLSPVELNDIEFETVTSKGNPVKSDSVKELDIQSVFAPDIPQPENSPANTIDGDLSTRYSSELMGTTIDFDLGQAHNISKVGVSFSDGTKRSTRFRIVVSQDGITWNAVRNVMSPSDTDDIVIYDIGVQNARYVRLVGYGNTQGSGWFSPTEVSIYSN